MYPTPADLCCSRFNQEIIFEVFQTFDIRVGLRIATGYRVVALDMQLANQDLTERIRLYPKVRRVLDLCQDFAGYIASLVEWRGSIFQKNFILHNQDCLSMSAEHIYNASWTEKNKRIALVS